MCLVIFAYRTHPRYPLLLAANRDEFHARPTAPAGFWTEHPDLLAGRDAHLRQRAGFELLTGEGEIGHGYFSCHAAVSRFGSSSGRL